MSPMVGIYSDINWLKTIPTSKYTNEEILFYFYLLPLGNLKHHTCFVYLTKTSNKAHSRKLHLGTIHFSRVGSTPIISILTVFYMY